MSTNFHFNNQNLKASFELLDFRQEGEIDIPLVLENLAKIGYDKNHPEIYDLFTSLGEGKVNYADYIHLISELMNLKDDDAGLQRMFDLLLFNPKLQVLDYDSLKKISIETGNSLTDSEIKFALNEIGNGKTIDIDSFIKFMKSN